MMTVFASQFASVAAPQLLRQMGESVTYTPRGGDAREITAIVSREQVQEFVDSQELTPVWSFQVLDDTTSGIGADELNLGGDQLTFPPRVGESAVAKRITRLVRNNAGMLTVECR